MTGADVLPDAPPDVLAELSVRERLLHTPAPGIRREDYDAQVVRGFWEVGASGGVFGLDVIWDVVRRRAEAAADGGVGADGAGTEAAWVTRDERCRVLADGVYLLTYLLIQGERQTRRVTIWRSGPHGWVAAYHQGTVVTGEW